MTLSCWSSNSPGSRFLLINRVLVLGVCKEIHFSLWSNLLTESFADRTVQQRYVFFCILTVKSLCIFILDNSKIIVESSIQRSFSLKINSRENKFLQELVPAKISAFKVVLLFFGYWLNHSSYSNQLVLSRIQALSHWDPSMEEVFRCCLFIVGWKGFRQ